MPPIPQVGEPIADPQAIGQYCGLRKVASTTDTRENYDVTVIGGFLAGRFAIVNDENSPISETDTFIGLTGIAGALDAPDFTISLTPISEVCISSVGENNKSLREIWGFH